jgi:predicted ATPase
MVIKSLELKDVGPFRFRPGAVTAVSDFGARIDFDPDVNLFVGPNNVGKSTILNAVDLLTERWSEPFLKRYQETVRFPSAANRASVAIEWRNDQDQYLRLESNYGVLSEAMRYLSQISEYGQRRPAHMARPADGYEYVPNVGRMQCFEPEAWSRACPYGEWDELKNSNFGYVGYATHTSYSLQNGDALAALWQSTDPFQLDVIAVIEFIVAKITSGFPMRISVDRSHGSRPYRIMADQTWDGQVSVFDLSLGTKYVLDWIIHFVINFAQRYARDPQWRERPAIFIIDEIDAHLHPSWQRRIIPTLKESFPNAQIFASTHSPMMVAGLKTGQVHLLKRDQTGMVTWSRNERDIVGWTADEIYRTFMGIDDPTDERTAMHAEELRVLREKEVRTADEEQRMQELRRLVNQDLLASGHINAQRGRFDAVMQDYLRSRTTGLSQDGD